VSAAQRPPRPRFISPRRSISSCLHTPLSFTSFCAIGVYVQLAFRVKTVSIATSQLLLTPCRRNWLVFMFGLGRLVCHLCVVYVLPSYFDVQLYLYALSSSYSTRHNHQNEGVGRFAEYISASWWTFCNLAGLVCYFSSPPAGGRNRFLELLALEIGYICDSTRVPPLCHPRSASQRRHASRRSVVLFIPFQTLSHPRRHSGHSRRPRRGTFTGARIFSNAQFFQLSLRRQIAAQLMPELRQLLKPLLVWPSVRFIIRLPILLYVHR